MLKNCLLIAASVSVVAAATAYAHHGHDHHEPPVIPPVDHHDDHHTPPVVTPPPVFTPPPVVEVPPPVVQPPVVQSAPPVVIQPPVNFQLPTVFQPSTALPTDVTGFRANINLPQQKPLSKEELAALTAKDPRFQFTGEWILFSANYSALAAPSSPYRPVGFDSTESPKQLGRIERTELPRGKFTEPAFMPTAVASYKKINDDHLKLIDGAVLVRAGDRPVFVSTKLCDEQVITRVSSGSIALVSAFDQKPTVLNLTDECCGAVALFLPTEEAGKHTSINLNAGQIAEAYRIDTHKPTSNLVATKIDVNRRIGKHCGLLVSQCHYLRALKKFNLVAALPQTDVDRVLKTAAALQYVRR